jgi:protein-L-isoaspartate(D-aspartate) O-methyltransferase
MRFFQVLFLGLLGMLANMNDLVFAQSNNPDYAARRAQLVRDILIPGGVKDQRVLDVIGSTPRHEFVEQSLRDRAYFDVALPIGEKQTISSPYIVAVMTEALETEPTDKVLEIGTGSGYQAAVLSPLVSEVYTIEIVERLGQNAAKLLQRLGYKNVFAKVGDGYLGWPDKAPFDKIIVTCSPEKVPQPLQDQLKEGGLMIIPVGERYQQILYLMRKRDGKLEQEALRPTLFVPMTGTAEDNREVKADPKNPKLLNGDFELPMPENGHVPNWYYQFGLKMIDDPEGPVGKQVVEFSNDSPHHPSLLLQGLPLDGRYVRRIRLSSWVATKNTKPTSDPDEQPSVIIQFFDSNRKRVAYYQLGPFFGNRPWKQIQKEWDVPLTSREAIVTIGLFGATGTAKFDGVNLEVLRTADADQPK